MKAFFRRINPARPLIWLLSQAARALLKAQGYQVTLVTTQAALPAGSSCARANSHHHSGKAGGNLVSSMNGNTAGKESSYSSACLGPAPSERTVLTFANWDKQYAKQRPGWTEAIRDQASGCSGFRCTSA